MRCDAEMNEEEEQKKVAKPRKTKQTKLDKDGNRPEVSVYAKAYNRVKTQFVRIRYGTRNPIISPHLVSSTEAQTIFGR